MSPPHPPSFVPTPSPSVAAPCGLDVVIALVALANLLALDTVTGPGAADPFVGVARLVLAALAFAAFVAALGRPALALARRGILDRDALALAGAAGSLAAGVVALGLGGHGGRAPAALEALGLRSSAWAGQRWGLVSAAGIAASALTARFAQARLRAVVLREAAATLETTGRARGLAAFDAELSLALARLAATERSPAAGSWDDAATRGVVGAALGCASFALVTHGILGTGPLGPTALSACVAVLVVASPSALLAAWPAARAIAVLRARAAGVVVKDAAALEDLAGVDVVCLEKNGTVTSDARAVRRLVWAPGAARDPALLADVAALEELASHPAGQVIAAYLARAGVVPSPLGPGARVVESPHGISGRVGDALVEVGSPACFGGPKLEAPHDVTAVIFGRNGAPAGRFELHAPLRPGAASTVHALRARGVRAVVTSGDRPEATALTAHHLRVPGSGGLGPAEKALAIRALQLAGARVLLVSDGWNDPRVAAQADLAIAVTPGALPGAVRAPIVVCRDRLDELPGLVDLARALRAVRRQNTALAAVYNAVLIPAAALGYLSPLGAACLALAEMLLGLGNAARLLHARVEPLSPT